jgi:hypothetical protein
MRNTNAIVVFTGKSIETIQAEGGSSAWKLNRANAMQFDYVVCCRSKIDWVEGPEPHKSAFLVGVIDGVEPAEDRPERWLIRISEYAVIQKPDVWQGWRNPVRYMTLEDLGIDPNQLDFKPMPKRSEQSRSDTRRVDLPTGLTFAEAKRGLSKTYGVPEAAIEITIRG